MHVLITGGLGYLGSRLAEYLTGKGDRVRILTRRSPDRFPDWAGAWDVRQVTRWEVDELAAAVDGIDAVFHLAAPDAQQAAERPVEALTAGSQQTWNLLEAVAGTGEGKLFLNVSSIFVYGPNVTGVITEKTPLAPVHPYAVGHMMSELVTRRFMDTGTVRALNVRLSNFFGRPVAPEAAKWSLVFNDLCRQAVREKRMTLNTSGTQQRAFMAMTDGVRALRLLVDRAADWPGDHTLLVGGELNLSILEVAERVADRYCELWGSRPEIRCPVDRVEEKPVPFQFDFSRLESLGFSWANPIDREIDETLTACWQWEAGK